MNEKIMFTAVIHNWYYELTYEISGYAKDEEHAFDMVLDQINQEYEVVEYMDCF